MTDQSLMDKSLRSVFVGNIPYEVTEEKLKDIFSEVGPVLSFKLVYDRETGKPKGYGFCEYKDQETALSAMRNLNGYEIGGRTLRVDNACTEKSRMEMQSLLQGPVVENPYGEAVQSDKAPEAISKAVASLPPEQMFELMKQMKLCVQNNPTEARAMLLQNPQLAYALLQAQVVMRIVDPHTAVSMLHKANPILQPLMASDKPAVPVPVPVPAPTATVAPLAMPVAPVPAPQQVVAPDVSVTVTQQGWTPSPVPPAVPRTVPLAAPVVAQPAGVPFIAPAASGDIDHRTPAVDPRMTRMGDQDLRMPPAGLVAGPQPVPPVPVPRDHRETGFVANSAEHFTRDPRVTAAERFPRDPRERVDPRTGTTPLPVSAPRPAAPVGPVTAPRPVTTASTASPSSGPGGASDQEKVCAVVLVVCCLCAAEETTPRAKTEKRGLVGINYGGFAGGYSGGYGLGGGHGEVKAITITKEVPVPVPHPYPVPVERKVPYPVSIPVKVPVDRPYPVHVPQPYPVPVEKPVPYPVSVPKPVPVPVPHPVVVKQPVPLIVKDAGFSGGYGGSYGGGLSSFGGFGGYHH